jgi:hypothetical protein
MWVIVCGMVMDVSCRHSENVWLPIVVTISGMLIDTKRVHPLKAPFPIVAQESGMMSDVKPEHPWNANDSIDVTEDGMEIEVRCAQLANAFSTTRNVKCAISMVCIPSNMLKSGCFSISLRGTSIFWFRIFVLRVHEYG